MFETPELLKKVEDTLKTVGSVVDDTVLQPPKEFVEALAEATPSPKVIEDIAREAGSTAEDVARETVAVVDEPIQEVGKAIAEGGQVLKEGAEALAKAVDLPTGTSVDIDVDSSSIETPSLGLDTFKPTFSLAATQKKPAGEITESLFEDFLFEKKYQAPELIARTVPLAKYTAPQGMFRNIV